MTAGRKKMNLGALRQLKSKGIPASAITAYDYPSAVFADEAGMDWILVGDSGGMTMLGYKNTLPVTMDEMLQFSKAVARGVKTAMLIGDMPFMSYQLSNESAVLNASRFLAEGGCEAVKLEGGIAVCGRIKAIVDAGIAVMGHLGLTPQSISLQGGYKVYGKNLKEYDSLLADAMAVEEAGASFLLLEAMPDEPAGMIRDALSIPVYGIGAGGKLDGQLLIMHDVLGTFVGDIEPKFAKRYLEGRRLITEALRSYAAEVRSGAFPAKDHLYPIAPEALAEIVAKHGKK
ncbi:MAG: 3-methyl-2-oxobutanoate hydroxymethyltransferase [Opitutae bacterium]|nr:3-methyl-2-oxobutanoate hydroxymethyltransferase [Opitutae bacterium]